MAAWSDRAESLLYDGESIERELSLDSATVVVTSHRVLAFTPEADGANFQQVDRPNVTGIFLGGTGDRTFLRYGLRAALYGLLLVVTGLFLPLDSVLSGVGLPSTSGQLGIGGVLGLFETMLELLRNLDDLLRLFGALLLLFAVVSFGVFLWSRERLLTIAVAGDDPAIEVPADGTGESVVTQLQEAVFPPGVDPSSEDGLLDSLRP